jgi:hypothetical protein
MDDVAVECFEDGRVQVTQAPVQPSRVISALDALEQRSMEPGPGRNSLRLDQLALQSGNEALGYSTVPALPGSTDRELHPLALANSANPLHVYC